MTQSKEKTKHTDIVGKEIEIDSIVAYSVSNSMKVGKVTKLNPKMVKVKEIKKITHRWNTYEYNKYPCDVVVLDGPETMLYVLKNS